MAYKNQVKDLIDQFAERDDSFKRLNARDIENAVEREGDIVDDALVAEYGEETAQEEKNARKAKKLAEGLAKIIKKYPGTAFKNAKEVDEFCEALADKKVEDNVVSLDAHRKAKKKDKKAA